MAFTKVTGPGIHTLANITSHNINSSGIITATKFVGPLEASSGSTGTFDSLTVTGNVGINENSPTGKLTITQDPQGFVDDSAQPQATFLIKHGTSGSNRRWVGIGASLTGAWIQSSSPGGTGLAAPLWINKGGGDVTLGNDKLLVKSGGSIGVNETTPDFSGFGGNGGGIELDDVNTGFTAVKLSQSGTDLYLVAHSGAAYISTRTNKAIVIEKNSTEVAKFTDNGLKFPNGKGIDFSANTDAGGTSSATLLEDYESGSYTSSIVSSNCTLDNSSGTGYYIKVGNMVYVRGLFSMNTQSGSPSKSGSDNIVQALPYAIKSGGTSMTGTMIVENINSGAPTSAVGHPLWYNVLPSGFVCLAGSNGIRFYINKIEAAYTRMNNSHLNVGYPGYTWMSWNIVYETN